MPLNEKSQAPRFTLADLQGQPHGLADSLRQGPVLLCFYKTECPTSELSLPYLQRFADAYPGLAVWGIAQDDAEAVSAMAARTNVGFLQLLDESPDYDVSIDFDIVSTPTLYLLDRDGFIQRVVEAFQRDVYNQLSQTVADMLQAEATVIAGDDAPAFRPG